MNYAPMTDQYYKQYYDQFSAGHNPAYQTISDFPEWLQGAGTNPLSKYQQQLPSYFNAQQLKQTANRSMDSQFNQQKAALDAASMAAQRRAGQSGGAVGSSFSQAAGMSGLYAQRNDQNAKIAQLIAQMRAQQAGLAGQVAGQKTSANQNHQGQLMDYTLQQQRMNAALLSGSNSRAMSENDNSGQSNQSNPGGTSVGQMLSGLFAGSFDNPAAMSRLQRLQSTMGANGYIDKPWGQTQLPFG